MRRILHIGNISGTGQDFALGLRKLGYTAKCINFTNENFARDFPCDQTYFIDYNRLRDRIFKFREIRRLARNYDILHFHYSSALPFGLDLPLLKRCNRKIVLHFHGDDIRGKNPNIIQSSYVDAMILSTPDLWKTSFFDNNITHYLPNPFYPIANHYEKQNHLAFNYKISDDIYYSIPIFGAARIKSIRPREQFLYFVASAKLYVDQLEIGWYGMAALEATWLETPAIAYIDPKLKEIDDQIPIMPCGKDVESLKEAIDYILDGNFDIESAKDLILKKHHYIKVSAGLIDIYDSL